MAMRGLLCRLFIAAAAFGATACSITRRVPQGSYLLRENVVAADRETPRRERIKPAELEQYIRQSPNKRLLGTDFYLWTYNAANPDRNTGWHRMLRRIGEQPVILDTTMASRSARNIKNYMDSRGYLDSEAAYTIDTARRRAVVTYHPRQGRPYRIGGIKYDFRDRSLEGKVTADSAGTLIAVGDVLDFSVLDRERKRIVEGLQSRGYYNFSVGNIYYVADTAAGGRLADITMVVRRGQAGYADNGEAIYEDNPVYRVKEVYIHPDFDPAESAVDSLYAMGFDTLDYRGLKVIYDQRPRVRSRILRRSIPIHPDRLYSASDVKKTYDNIMGLGFYKSASIIFSPVGSAADTSGIGDRYLNCNILCTPALRQSYTVELEGSTTSSFYALMARIGYQNRNLLRGAEQLDISLVGGYEFMRVKGTETSFEVGGSVSVSFPRFVMLPGTDPANARTRLEFSINAQQRPYYHRTLSSAVLGYGWNGRGRSSYQIRPLDLSLVKMSYVDEAFLESIENEYLRNSYTNQLIAGISGSYVYNGPMSQRSGNSLTVRLNWETAGNLLHGLSSLLDSREEHGGYELFGIRYAQYFRADASVGNSIFFGPRTSVAYRLYGGYGVTYGNTQGLSMPFDRLFYSGGANSMRGWQVRTLGIGGALKPEGEKYPSRMGNLKLEANLEARFPVWGILNGALFFDAGNVWLTREGDTQSGEEKFELDRFYRQLGLNTGLGARFDFRFFLLRVDWGVKLHDPNRPAGERWTRNFRVGDTVLTFGVGYPF